MTFSFADPLPRPAAGGGSGRRTIYSLTDTSADQVKLIRTLIGAADLRHAAFPALLIHQRFNFSRLGPSSFAKLNYRELSKVLKQVDVPIKNLEGLLSGRQVKSLFHHHLLQEICWYFIRTECESHTTAFLHLYRALERVSYAFPMAYAAATTDYLRTFEELKKFLKDPEQGELKFFRAFVENTLEAPLLDAICELDFSGCSYAKNYCSAIEGCLVAGAVTQVDPSRIVSVQHRFLFQLVITIRNRFFHFLSGAADKFSADDLPDSDKFFFVLNPRLINWLGVIYFKILSIEINK